VWSILDKYSKTLGWGLTGIQPECWTLLDLAVEELKKRRAADEQIIRIITRMRCGCLSKDCTAHGSYIAGDDELRAAMTYEKTLFPKTVQCAHVGQLVRYEQFYNVHKCDKCGQEYRVAD
jgi:hypothetical protein